MDLASLDYEGKTRALEQIAQQLSELRIEYATVSGKAAELRAQIVVLNSVRSALQSALRAERDG